ncbi:hypothetical protein L6452_22729 [Arctium lappa]|uniref:Uncharacterized protein n=1 Tax=Arctium lappa TaxID=4217 RepID=A0ACB9B001_ARCLA|nr:hypothetical protein L6452_22729 [Arctium lappa]
MLLRASPTIFLPNGAAADAGENFSGVVFEPFEEVKKESMTPNPSLTNRSSPAAWFPAWVGELFFDFQLKSFEWITRRDKGLALGVGIVVQEGVLEELGSRGVDTVSVAYIKQSLTAVRKGGCEFSF